MLLTKPRKPMLMSLTAADLMTRNVVSIAENASLHEAVALMADRGYSGAPVINEAGRPVGVLTQSDVLTHDRNKVRYAKPVPEYYQRADLRSATGEDVAGFQVVEQFIARRLGHGVEPYALLRLQGNDQTIGRQRAIKNRVGR
mgnify:CR=1 FL=1